MLNPSDEFPVLTIIDSLFASDRLVLSATLVWRLIGTKQMALLQLVPNEI